MTPQETRCRAFEAALVAEARRLGRWVDAWVGFEQDSANPAVGIDCRYGKRRLLVTFTPDEGDDFLALPVDGDADADAGPWTDADRWIGWLLA